MFGAPSRRFAPNLEAARARKEQQIPGIRDSAAAADVQTEEVVAAGNETGRQEHQVVIRVKRRREEEPVGLLLISDRPRKSATGLDLRMQSLTLQTAQSGNTGGGELGQEEGVAATKVFRLRGSTHDSNSSVVPQETQEDESEAGARSSAKFQDRIQKLIGRISQHDRTARGSSRGEMMQTKQRTAKCSWKVRREQTVARGKAARLLEIEERRKESAGEDEEDDGRVKVVEIDTTESNSPQHRQQPLHRSAAQAPHQPHKDEIARETAAHPTPRNAEVEEDEDAWDAEWREGEEALSDLLLASVGASAPHASAITCNGRPMARHRAAPPQPADQNVTPPAPCLPPEGEFVYDYYFLDDAAHGEPAARPAAQVRPVTHVTGSGCGAGVGGGSRARC